MINRNFRKFRNLHGCLRTRKMHTALGATRSIGVPTQRFNTLILEIFNFS